MKTQQLSTLQIVEKPGNHYASLQMAQSVSLSDIAQAVARAMREGLAKGKLTVVNGRINITEKSI